SPASLRAPPRAPPMFSPACGAGGSSSRLSPGRSRTSETKPRISGRASARSRPASCACTSSRSRWVCRCSPFSSSSSSEEGRAHTWIRCQASARHLSAGMNSWVSTTLIVLPFAGALAVWILPWTNLGAGGFALLVALAEVGLWIQAAVRFDFGGGLQFQQKTPWFSDLGVFWHVGFYGFSLWLAGLTVVVMAATIAYGFWAGRERPRAYFGLMLMLTGAIVGVFASQDLLVFYVFWEAMMIPLYFLIGIWGGAGRLGATIKFLIYTLAGSLLMLASVVAFGITQGTFDLVDSGTSGSTIILLGFLAGFAVKAPLFPLHGWLPDAYRESPPEVAAVLSGVVSKAATYGFLRIALPKFPGPVGDLRVPILVLAATGLVY